MQNSKTKDQLNQEIRELKSRLRQMENQAVNSRLPEADILPYCSEYRTLFENLPQQIFIKDLNSTYIYCNKPYADMLRIRQEEIKGKTDFDFHIKEYAEKYRKDDQRIITAGQIEQIEEPYFYNNQPKVARTVKIPVKDSKGKVIQLIGIVDDITERKETERKLADSEANFRSLFENSMQAIAQHKIILNSEGVPVDYQFIRINKMFETLTGLKAEDIIGKTVVQIMPGIEKENFIKIYGEVALTGKPVKFEQYNYTLKKYFEISAYSPEKGYFVAAFNDITGLKENEKTIVENQARLKRIVDSNMIGIFFWGADGNIVDANDAFLDMVGYTRQELIEGQINWRVMTPPEYKEKDEQMLKLLKTQETIPPFEKEYFRKDGTRVPIILGSTVLHESREQGVCFILDITERKKTQEQIKNMAKFPEENPSPVMRLSTSGEIIYANKAAAVFLEDCAIEQGKCLDKEILGVLERAYFSGQPHAIERKYKQRTYLLSFAPILGNDYINIYAYDITKRKLLEVALEKRVVAMAQPLDQPGNLDFDVLFNIKEIQELQDLFAKSAKVASIITLPDGIPITKPSNFCRLCNDIIRKTEKGLKNCFCSDAVIGKHSDSGAIIQPCLSAGLWDAGASITVGGKHIANWLIGQVRNEEQDKDKIREYAREIGADPEEFIKAFEEVPVMSKEQFQHVADTLFVMANLLSSSAYQNIQQARFITERKKAEDDLVASNKRFQELFENMSSGVAIFLAVKNGEDFIFKDFNRAAEAIDNIRRRDVIGKRLTEVFPGAKEFGFFEVFKRVFQTGQPEHFPDTIYKDNRIEGWRQNYVYKLPSGEVISIYDDVTEQKKIEQQEKEIFAAKAAAEVEKRKTEELVEAYKELQLMQDQLLQSEKLASIGQLGAGIAHELNSPLSGVLSLLRSYKKEKEINSEEYSDLEEMEKACDHMAKIIKGLNSFSRQSTGEIEAVNCNEAIKSTLSFSAYQLEKKNVKIETDLAVDLWQIKANHNQIQQIIVNMINNACDASLPEGIFRIMTNNVTINGKLYVEMRFEDNGCGIAKDNLPKIFDPFFTTKRPGGGVGLGLSIVYKIVENYKGTVRVESVEGQGTIFTVRLPVD